MNTAPALIEVRDLKTYFGKPERPVRAVDAAVLNLPRVWRMRRFQMKPEVLESSVQTVFKWSR